MKAIDYFNKYKLSITDNKKLTELLIDMNHEVQEIAKKRNTNSDSSTISIIKEMNQKWNKLCAIYEKEYGEPILKRNGYMKYLQADIPQLKNM